MLSAINKNDKKSPSLLAIYYIKSFLVIGTVVGVSVALERECCEYLYNDENNTVEERREETVSNSFCYPALNKDMQPGVYCRWDTPEFLMKLHGYMPTKRV
jgi:hypothetical protein